MKTAIDKMIEYVDGLLAIENRLIVQYSDSPQAVSDIKENWQQLNMIKEAAIKLKDEEKQQIIDAWKDAIDRGEFDISGSVSDELAEKYYNETFKK